MAIAEWGVAQWVIIIATLVVGIIAIRLSLKLDINQWKRDRRKTLREKIMVACPHIDMNMRKDGRIEYTCLFVSPAGTFQFQCTRCGTVTSSPTIQEDTINFYANNIEAYLYRIKKMNRLVKKLYDF